MYCLSMYKGCLYFKYYYYYQLIDQHPFMVKLSKTFNMNSCKLSAWQRIVLNSTQNILLIVISLGTINTGYAPHYKESDKTNNNINWNLNLNMNSNIFMATPLPQSSQMSRISSNNTYIWSLGDTIQHHHMIRCKKFYKNRVHRISNVDYLNGDVKYIDEFKENTQNNNLSSRNLNNITGDLRVIDVSTVDVNDNIINNNNNNNNNFDNLTIVNNSMSFGTDNLTVVTTQVGANAHIPCVVHNIGDGVVSWIRKKDYHLLTVGLTVYSSDERFSTTHHKDAEDWTLQIKYVQPRDAGIYECQVSTHPPTSIFLHLNVVEARAEISGPLIRYLTPDSMLRLHCKIIQNTETSDYIFWYNDNRMINYDTERGINVSTDPDFQSSELIIAKTRREHSGNYTCVARNAQSASVLVHIFKGDNPAAMYHGDVRPITICEHGHLKIIIFMVIIVLKKWQLYYN